MKYILLFLFILCSSYSCIAQQSFSLQIGTDIGLLQVQRNELMMLQDRNKYNSRIAPFIEAEYRIPKSKLIVGSILRYSFSDIVIFIGGNPWFANDNEGFPKIHLKNEHIEGTLYLKYPFFENKKIKFYGRAGFFIGVPQEKNVQNFVEGISYPVQGEPRFELHYTVGLSGIRRNSMGIESGVNFDIPFNDYWLLSFSAAYRLGLVQSVNYFYYGEMYSINNSTPVIDYFQSVFSNNGGFLSAGLKWYLW